GQRPRFSYRRAEPTTNGVKIGPILPRGVVWNKSTLDLPRRGGQGSSPGCGRPGPSARLRHSLRGLGDEIVGGLLCGAVAQALSQLGELAADLRLHVVGQKRAAVLVGERYLGSAFGKARDAALPFAGNPVAVGRIEIGQPHLAFPARL